VSAALEAKLGQATSVHGAVAAAANVNRSTRIRRPPVLSSSRSLEDDDDVHNVYSNFEVSDVVMAS